MNLWPEDENAKYIILCSFGGFSMRCFQFAEGVTEGPCGGSKTIKAGLNRVKKRYIFVYKTVILNFTFPLLTAISVKYILSFCHSIFLAKYRSCN